MDKKKNMLIIQSLLWILTAVVLIAADLWIYLRGTALRSADPATGIYTVEVIRQAALFAVPVLLAAIGMSVFCAVSGIRDRSADQPVRGLRISKPAPPDKASDRRRSFFTSVCERKLMVGRVIILAAAIGFIIAGILNGSMRDVFIKASKICTECIGLG